MITCQTTQTELEIHFKAIYFLRNIPTWTLNSIKMTDHVYELTRNEDFNLTLDAEINLTEIIMAFQSLKRRKAIGIDRISGEALKDNFEILQHCFLYTFNRIFESAVCPTEWKTAIVTLYIKVKAPEMTRITIVGNHIYPRCTKDTIKSCMQD